MQTEVEITYSYMQIYGNNLKQCCNIFKKTMTNVKKSGVNKRVSTKNKRSDETPDLLKLFV